MSKIPTVILVIAYTVLLIRYLKITLRGRNPDVIELNYVIRPPNTFFKLMKRLKQMNNSIISPIIINKREDRLPTDLKFILKWTDTFLHYSQDMFKNGQGAFIESNCEYQNCFFTSQKTLLLDPSYFDAILFNVENDWDPFPAIRHVRQNYIFTASESASNFPVCLAHFESFYNLTWTYKLDSDIRWSYITVFDLEGRVVGPKADMKWVSPMAPTSESITRRLVHKRKAAAWFVSHCKVPSGREVIAKKLIDALDRYKLTVHTYGWCGKMSCPKERMEECLDLLEQDYYFYFAFEDSFSEDYVTKKLLYPLMHFTVPIVYGGANYSRFLPPGSYIDARELNATEVAFRINQAIKNPSVYHDYFRWHAYYQYKEKLTSDICELCRVLNTKNNNPAKQDFRKWWNPNHNEHCRAQLKSTQ